MSAIITHRFRKNNVQNIFDEMTLPKVMISGCSSSGPTVTPSSGVIPANLQPGMAVNIVPGTSGTGALSASNVTIVTSVSSGTFTISPNPDTPLSNALLSFFTQYYVGIGKSDPYSGGLDGSDLNPGAPVAARKTEVDTLNNLIALQRVSVALNTGSNASQSAIVGNAGYVLPRYNWNSGYYVKPFDSSDPSCLYPSTITVGSSSQHTAYPCYAVYNSGSGDRVYICVQSGMELASPSTTLTPPSTNATTLGTVGNAGSDSYRWVYVANLGLDTAETLSYRGLTTSSGNTSSTLDSNQFFKIYRRSSSVGTTSTNTTSMASAGGIYSARIVFGGTGYTAGSAFTVKGDGANAAGTISAVNAAGGITQMTFSNNGSGYTTGTVEISGPGSGAIVIPRIAPRNGFGYDMTSDLPAWYAGFFAKFSYDTVYPGTADVPSTDQIRQVSLVRNPVVFNSSTGSTITFRCLKTLTINTTSSAYLPAAGDVIESTSGAGSGARAYVDYVVSNGGTSTVYYHQNSSKFGTYATNLTPIPFNTSSSNSYKIYRKSGGYNTTVVSSGTYITAASPSEEYTDGTGEVIFVQNRVPITQAAGQSESISIVTQF